MVSALARIVLNFPGVSSCPMRVREEEKVEEQEKEEKAALARDAADKDACYIRV